MSPARLPYVGRFAPSPSGPLHAGSLVAAMASYLDAKLHRGIWLLRIEDIDETRTVPDAVPAIMQALQSLGMTWDDDKNLARGRDHAGIDAIAVQSRRKNLYQSACDQLAAHVFPCACTRKEIIDSVTRTGIPMAADGAAVYPGTCRHGIAPEKTGKAGRTLRVRVPDADDSRRLIQFDDRWCGRQTQDLARQAGDFVLRRADGFWAYQLAVVVDDAAQGVNNVVRGADLIDSTARQIYLQQLLGLPTPGYLHVPLLAAADGEKLSKQNGAAPLDLQHPVDALIAAACFLGLEGISEGTASVAAFWPQAIVAWDRRLQSLDG